MDAPEKITELAADTLRAWALDEDLKRRVISTPALAGLAAFPGAEVVKAFNQLPANVLARQLPADDGKMVVFIASNSGSASKEISRIAEILGYSPVELGRVDEGGRLIQARNALVLRQFIERPMF